MTSVNSQSPVKCREFRKAGNSLYRSTYQKDNGRSIFELRSNSTEAHMRGRMCSTEQSFLPRRRNVDIILVPNNLEGSTSEKFATRISLSPDKRSVNGEDSLNRQHRTHRGIVNDVREYLLKKKRKIELHRPTVLTPNINGRLTCNRYRDTSVSSQLTVVEKSIATKINISSGEQKHVPISNEEVMDRILSKMKVEKKNTSKYSIMERKKSFGLSLNKERRTDIQERRKCTQSPSHLLKTESRLRDEIKSLREELESLDTEIAYLKYTAFGAPITIESIQFHNKMKEEMNQMRIEQNKIQVKFDNLSRYNKEQSLLLMAKYNQVMKRNKTGPKYTFKISKMKANKNKSLRDQYILKKRIFDLKLDREIERMKDVSDQEILKEVKSLDIRYNKKPDIVLKDIRFFITELQYRLNNPSRIKL